MNPTNIEPVTDQNPSAFPRPYTPDPSGQHQFFDGAEGMTLRDYFAAKAIALFSFDRADIDKLESGQSPNHRLVAKTCYGLADAMLEARKGAA